MKSTAIVLFFALSLCLASCKKENHITPDVTTTVPDISDFEMNASSAPFNVPILIAGKNDVRGLIDGPGADARFFGPGAIFVNADGTLLVGEGANKTIRKSPMEL